MKAEKIIKTTELIDKKGAGIKAEKIIKTTEPIDIEIKGITLLSIEEYERYHDLIPLHASYWWLRSPYSYDSDCAGFVDDYGIIDHRYVGDSGVGVSPALICNLKSLNLKPRDIINFTGYIWTVISDKYIQCDDIIGETAFREDWKATDANDYEKSDVKKWLENWAKEQGIE